MQTYFTISILGTCISLTFSEIEFNFKKASSAAPAVVDNPKQLQIQKVFGLTTCAILCSRTFCREFQYSHANRLCITRHRDTVSGGVINPGGGLFNNYIVIQQDPKTCADIRKDNPAAQSGEYRIMPPAPQFKDVYVKVYCLMNGTHQLEYVTLPNENVGNFPRRSSSTCRNDQPYLVANGIGQDGITVFQKIRIIPSTMAVVRSDTTFTTGNKTKPHLFGRAEDCYSWVGTCKRIGTFRIDTLGTGMKFATDLMWSQAYRITRSHDGAVIDLVCGGWCGRCDPIGDMVLFPNSQDIQL